jgi:hypothetical protein
VKLRTLSVAELDAANAALRYEEQQPGLGDQFLAELEHAMDRIRLNPEFLPRMENYTGELDLRRCLLHRFPFLVLFLCQPDEIVIVAVSDVRRHPSHWLERLR